LGGALRKGIRRKTIFLVAFLTLPLRGFLFTLTDSPYGVVAIQLLDGVAAGIFGVISIIIAADIIRGTGRFNLAQGLVALSTSLGAALSNVCSGFIVQWFGYATGFITFAGIALGGLIFFGLLMPETRNDTISGFGPSAAKAV
jgi:predicted MFS family arabinose efflux permease